MGIIGSQRHRCFRKEDVHNANSNTVCVITAIYHTNSDINRQCEHGQVLDIKNFNVEEDLTTPFQTHARWSSYSLTPSC